MVTLKGFYQYLAPFAPDFSGASSVLYDAGGMIVMCDPGGCSGIIGGYDEPRFYDGRTPLYSAALREMDTIFGRDGRLAEKIEIASAIDKPLFISLLSGPTISLIGADLDAVARGIEQDTGIPSFWVETSGMHMYDLGEQMAYLALLDRFLPPSPTKTPTDTPMREGGHVVVLGATPLGMPGGLDIDAFEALARHRFGDECIVIGRAKTLETLRDPSSIASCVVVSPTGLAAAHRLEKEWDIPFEVWFPDNPGFDTVVASLHATTTPDAPSRILIIHQQIVANALRERIAQTMPRANVDVASFFMMDENLSRLGDRFCDGEDSFFELIGSGTGDNSDAEYDVIVCDPFYGRALEGFAGHLVAFPQVAVSGDFYL